MIRAVFFLFCSVWAAVGLANESHRVKEQHPRVYLDNQRLAVIKAEVAKGISGHSLLYDAWRDTEHVANRYAERITDGEIPVSVGSGSPYKIALIAKTLSLAYLVTEEERYLSASRRYIRSLIAERPHVGGDYSQAGRIEAMGVLYDWLYDNLTSNEKQDLRRAILQTIPHLSDYLCGKGNALKVDWTCAMYPSYPSAIGGHSYENNRGVLTGVLAIIDEQPDLQPLLATLNYNYRELFYPLRSWVAADGAFHMGWGYGATYLSLHAVKLWQSATHDVDFSASWQGNIVDFFIYGLRGDLSFPRSGDGKGKQLGSQNLVLFALESGQQHGKKEAFQFYHHWLRPAQAGARIEELLFLDPIAYDNYLKTRAADSPVMLPPGRRFENAGFVLARDSWDYPEAVLLSFKSSPFWSKNHHHLDQNAFTLFYKVPLLIDSGEYDRYGSSHWYNYYTRSVAHNVVTVFDPSESFGAAHSKVACCSNDGGQKIMQNLSPLLEDIQSGGSNALDGVTAYSHSSRYTYMRGNASKAYHSNKLDQRDGFIRDLFFYRSGNGDEKPVVVVFDQLNSVEQECCFSKRFLLHFPVEPTAPSEKRSGAGKHKMDGAAFVTENQGVFLRVDTVLPENPVITKIGGSNSSVDYRYQLTGPSGSLESYSPRDTVLASEGAGRATDSPNSWRVEVTGNQQLRRERFLHVIRMGDVGSEALSAVENMSDSSIFGVKIGSEAQVYFSNSRAFDTVVEHARSAELPDMFIAGLAAGERYLIKTQMMADDSSVRITFSPAATGSFVADEGGVLTLLSEELEAEVSLHTGRPAAG